MATLSRQRNAVAAGVRTFIREPTNVALLVVLPPVVLIAFELVLDPLAEAPGLDFEPGAAELGGALFATAFLAGLLGVFQVVGAADSDRRLVVCGYHPVEVLVARLLTILMAGTLVAAITFTTFWLRTDVTPERPLLAFGALLGAAVLYGLVGVAVGALLGRELEGSLVLVFLADVDAFGSIGAIPTETDVLAYFPLAAPHDVLEAAVYDGAVATGDVLQMVAYAVALGVIALGAVVLGGKAS